jgi:hypothetical protein
MTSARNTPTPNSVRTASSFHSGRQYRRFSLSWTALSLSWSVSVCIVGMSVGGLLNDAWVAYEEVVGRSAWPFSVEKRDLTGKWALVTGGCGPRCL